MTCSFVFKGLEGTAEAAIPGDNLDVTTPTEEAVSEPAAAAQDGDEVHNAEILQVSESFGILPKVAMFSAVVGIIAFVLKKRSARGEIAYKSIPA